MKPVVDALRTGGGGADFYGSSSSGLLVTNDGG